MAYTHLINRNTKPGDRKGSILRHGEFIVRFGSWLSLSWSWNLWSSFCHCGVSVGGEDGPTFSAALPPVSLWFSVDFKPLRSAHWRYDWYEFRWAIHHRGLWVSLWADDSEHSFVVPFWHRHRRRFNIDFEDLLLGRSKYTENTILTGSVDVPMPEGSYAAEFKIFESTWKRPRWFARRLVRTTIDLEKPIPFPGKGENSWDCGMGGTHGITGPWDNTPDAVGGVVASVTRSRNQYGGRNWLPPGADVKRAVS